MELLGLGNFSYHKEIQTTDICLFVCFQCYWWLPVTNPFYLLPNYSCTEFPSSPLSSTSALSGLSWPQEHMQDSLFLQSQWPFPISQGWSCQTEHFAGLPFQLVIQNLRFISKRIPERWKSKLKSLRKEANLPSQWTESRLADLGSLVAVPEHVQGKETHLLSLCVTFASSGVPKLPGHTEDISGACRSNVHSPQGGLKGFVQVVWEGEVMLPTSTY